MIVTAWNPTWRVHGLFPCDLLSVFCGIHFILFFWFNSKDSVAHIGWWTSRIPGLISCFHVLTPISPWHWLFWDYVTTVPVIEHELPAPWIWFPSDSICSWKQCFLWIHELNTRSLTGYSTNMGNRAIAKNNLEEFFQKKGKFFWLFENIVYIVRKKAITSKQFMRKLLFMGIKDIPREIF